VTLNFTNMSTANGVLSPWRRIKHALNLTAMYSSHLGNIKALSGLTALGFTFTNYSINLTNPAVQVRVRCANWCAGVPLHCGVESLELYCYCFLSVPNRSNALGMGLSAAWDTSQEYAQTVDDSGILLNYITSILCTINTIYGPISHFLCN
jgi:hypothetical protein